MFLYCEFPWEVLFPPAARCAADHRLGALEPAFCNSLSPPVAPAMVMHLYQVVGRHLPVEKKDGSVDNNTKIYRMKVFAEDEVRARALFFSQPPLGGRTRSRRRARRARHPLRHAHAPR